MSIKRINDGLSLSLLFYLQRELTVNFQVDNLADFRSFWWFDETFVYFICISVLIRNYESCSLCSFTITVNANIDSKSCSITRC